MSGQWWSLFMLISVRERDIVWGQNPLLAQVSGGTPAGTLTYIVARLMELLGILLLDGLPTKRPYRLAIKGPLQETP